MKSNEDITKFWLAWRELCAIRLCMNAELVRTRCKGNIAVAENSEMVAKQARDVIETTNKYFASMIRSPRDVKPLKKFAGKMAADRAQSFDGQLENDDHSGDISTSDTPECLQLADNGSPISSIGSRLSWAGEDPDEQVPSRIGGIHVMGDETKRGKLISEYIDLVDGWDQHDEMTTSAFELVEIDLYGKADKKLGDSDGNDSGDKMEPMLKGKKLKDYLFEDIGGRSGGLCQNLWGFLLKKEVTVVKGRKYPSRLRMVANASFRNPVEDKPFNPDDDASPNELVDPNSLEPDMEILVRQAGKVFRAYLRDRWATEFDVTDRIVFCCAFFRYVLSDPFVEALVTIPRSTLNLRKTKRVSELFTFLRDTGFAPEDVRGLFQGLGQNILAEFARGDPMCVKLMKHFGD